MIPSPTFGTLPISETSGRQDYLTRVPRLLRHVCSASFSERLVTQLACLPAASSGSAPCFSMALHNHWTTPMPALPAPHTTNLFFFFQFCSSVLCGHSNVRSEKRAVNRAWPNASGWSTRVDGLKLRGEEHYGGYQGRVSVKRRRHRRGKMTTPTTTTTIKKSRVQSCM